MSYSKLTATEQKQVVADLYSAEKQVARASLGLALAKSEKGKARAQSQVNAALAAHSLALKALN
jgi:NOL1/NOP2/fmu family ribosome biogenesis protein